MTHSSGDIKVAGLVEGGIDAIVIGGTADGLAAAAYLGRAGLRTVLLEGQTEFGGPIRKREIGENLSVIDGEHVVTSLNEDVIEELDLYRHGLSYASRRLGTTYFFDDGESLRLDGDLIEAANLLPPDMEGAGGMPGFLQGMTALSEQLRPVFESVGRAGGAEVKNLEKTLAKIAPDAGAALSRYIMASVDDVLSARFPEGRLRTLLSFEAAFRSGAAPDEAFSFMGLLRRLAGEVSGLQAAIGYPSGGCVSVIETLRRAAQAARVDIRAAMPVKAISIEADRVAGVVLDNGGQLRAQLIVSAVDAERTYAKLIGARFLDVEFQERLSRPRTSLSSGRLQFTLKGAAKNEATKENMTRRLVYAPPPEALRAAFADARAGDMPKDVMLEAVFPEALDGKGMNENEQLVSVMAHPFPFDAKPGENRRKEITKIIFAMLERFMPGVEDRAGIIDLTLPADLAARTGAAPQVYASRPNIMQQWAISSAASSASRIAGLYFCGPEAQIGEGLILSAGRAAGKTAIRDVKKGVYGR